MKKVYYRGEAYDSEIVELTKNRLYVLYKDGELKHYVKEDELDIRSRVSMILDDYYSSIKPTFISGISK